MNVKLELTTGSLLLCHKHLFFYHFLGKSKFDIWNLSLLSMALRNVLSLIGIDLFTPAWPLLGTLYTSRWYPR